LVAIRLSLIVTLCSALLSESFENDFEKVTVEVSSAPIIAHDGQECLQFSGRSEVKPLVFKNIEDVVPRNTKRTFLILHHIPE
jgi:hypothetical protein